MFLKFKFLGMWVQYVKKKTDLNALLGGMSFFFYDDNAKSILALIGIKFLNGGPFEAKWCILLI